VSFVNQERRGRRRGSVSPDIGRGRPDLSVENTAYRILNDAPGVSGNAVAASAGPFEKEAVKVAVREGLGRQADFPDAVCRGRKRPGAVRLPVCPVADQVDGSGMGGPFPENPFVSFFMQAEKVVRQGQSRPFTPEDFFPRGNARKKIFQPVRVRPQVGI